MRSGRFLSIRAAAVLLLWAGTVAAAEIKIPPSPDQWATDTAGFLSPGALTQINSQLRASAALSGRQVLLYIGKTTGGYSIEDFAVKTFEAWKPGRKGLDDGLVLFIMADDQAMRIEVGYGLEDKVTDAAAAKIINDVLVPKFRAGERDEGVRQAVGQLLEIVSGTNPAPTETLPSSAPRKKTGQPSLMELILMIIGGIFFLGLLITHPRLAVGLLRVVFVLAGGGFGGRSGGGGGGFSGGGGRSGGGGASGSW